MGPGGGSNQRGLSTNPHRSPVSLPAVTNEVSHLRVLFAMLTTKAEGDDVIECWAKGVGNLGRPVDWFTAELTRPPIPFGYHRVTQRLVTRALHPGPTPSLRCLLKALS